MIDLKNKEILSEFKNNVKKNLEEYYTKNCYDEYGWKDYTFVFKFFDSRNLYSMYEIVIDNATEIMKKNTISSIKTKSIFHTEIKYIKYSEMINSILKLYGSERQIVAASFEWKFFNADHQYLRFMITDKK